MKIIVAVTVIHNVVAAIQIVTILLFLLLLSFIVLYELGVGVKVAEGGLGLFLITIFDI